MYSTDAQGKVGVGHAPEASSAQHTRKVALIRELSYRLYQVLVSSTVIHDDLSEGRNDVEGVLLRARTGAQEVKGISLNRPYCTPDKQQEQPLSASATYCIVDLLEQRVIEVRKLKAHKTPSRLEDAVSLGQCTRDVSHVSNPKCDREQIH